MDITVVQIFENNDTAPYVTKCQ